MAYTKTEWVTGAPITQEKMNKIEQGIADAHDSNSVNTTNIDSINSFINDTITPAITTLSSDQANMKLDLTNMQWYGEMGKNAWTEVQDALIYDENDPPQIVTHLNKRISDIEDIAESSAQEVIAARKGERILRDKIDDMDLRTDVLYGNIDTINRTFNEASQSPYENKLGFANTIKDRLDNSEQKLVETMNELAATHESTAFGRRKTQDIDDSFLSLDSRLEEGESRIVSLEQEVAAAHESTALNKTGVAAYETLDQRFEAIESELVGQTNMSTRLDTIENNVTDLSNNKVNKTDIANNLTTDTTGKVLDAYQGKILNDGKINYTDIIDNLASTATDAPLSAKQGKVLADRIDLIDNPSTGTVYGLDTRITAAESAISHAASGNDAGGLTERLTAAEGDINTIANELSMYNTQTGAIEATNSRVDTIEANVVAIGKEIGMIQDDAAVVDLSTAVSRTDTRVDGIENEINDAHRVLSEGTDTLDNRFDDAETRLGVLESDLNTATTGVKARINTIESDLNTAATGIKARLDAIDTPNTGAIAQLQEADTALDARLDAIDGGTVLTGTALKDRVATVESDLNTTTTGIKARVTALEGKDTIIVSKPVIGSNYLDGTPNITSPSTAADYLIQADDDKYYYWRYFSGETGWQLISSAGSNSGNNSGYDYPVAQDYDDLQVKAENTDYYVNRSDGYHHYRWVTIDNILTEIEIGNVVDTSKIKTYNIAKVAGKNSNNEDVYYLNLYQYDYGVTNAVDTESDSPIAQIELPMGGGGGSSFTNTRLTRIGNQTIQTIVGSTIKLQVFYSSYDGNEYSDGDYTLRVGDTIIDSGVFNSGAEDETISGWKANTAGYYEFDVTDKCKIGNTNFQLTVSVNGNNIGKAWTVNIIDLHLESSAPDTLLINSDSTYAIQYTPFGALTKTLHVLIDSHEIGTQSLIAATSGRISSYTIPAQAHGAHTIEMYLTATIGNIEQQTDSIIREYIWYDATNTSVPVILASKYNEQTITAQQYSTVEIPYQVYKKDAETIDVYYYLDDEETEFDKVTLDGTNVGTLSYLASDSGAHTITIKVDNVSIEVNLVITALSINVAPVSGAIIDFDPTTLTNNSTNRLPSWTDGNNTYTLTVSDNFNWSDNINGGGYKTEEDGKCFVVKAGSYVDLNYNMFQEHTVNNQSTSVFDDGAEIKIIFKTKAVRNADAIWFTNTGDYNNKTVGIQLGAHVGWLKTNKAADITVDAVETEDTITINNTVYNKWKPNTSYDVNAIVIALDEDGNKIIYKCKEAHTSDEEFADDNWLKMGAADTEILATNSYLYLPYSEKDKIELDININKYSAGSSNNFIMSYEDGVPSKAYAYTYGVSGDKLINNSGIRIGSPDCDVCIYRLRIYKNSLDTDQILQNFIADGRNIDEKVARYNKNCIYWDSTLEQYFTSPSGTAILDPIKLAERIPDVKVLMLDTPVFTVGKKNFIQNSTLRCLQADGGNVYTSRGDADNWLFTNGFHAGQGTTSDNYGQSARNVDFLFEVDGVHYPTKAKNMKGYTPSSNYVSSVYVGKNASEWVEVDSTNHINAWQPKAGATPSICSDWKGDDCKVSLTNTSIPNNYFNLKVNVASSENVNNALFQERFNTYLNSVYESPAYKRNHKIKNDMEFVPAVLFVRENQVDAQGNPKGHTEFNDCNWHFYALGNIGDSKKTDYTRAYNPYDMGEFTVENSDNNTNNGQFQSGVFMYNGTRAIETDYAEWVNDKAYEQNDIVTKEGRMYKRSGATMAALGENETATWIAADWTDITPVTTMTIYYAPRTNPNPMDYLYGIDTEEWNTKMTVPDSEGTYHYINRKHDKLITEKFDGDHSFEFRYACLGDYRDGDLINDTTGLAKSQEKTNQNIVFNFYEWLMTATDAEYEAEAENWFVPEAMEFFYAFTHYYTMMDNRAKNTFWHWGKRYISSNDANGTTYNAAREQAVTAQSTYDDAVAELAAVKAVQDPIIEQADIDIASADAILQEDPDNAEALESKESANESKTAASALVAAAQATVDAAKTQLTIRILKRDELKFLYDNASCFIVDNAKAAINDGRRFDLWAYDMDTAVGIDNNGALVFPYGKEDDDYRVKGESSSGYAFNGAGSIFWRRLKKTFADDIVTIMNNVDVECFNSENLIEQFDTFQNCFPEEIWRLDIERKYIRTFTGKSIDNSITTGKQNPRFLTSMMQGRKKYQRRQWIRDQGVYFNSKYRLTDIMVNDNTVEFNIVSPTNKESLTVQPSYNLELTPYQDMYLNIVVGNGSPVPQIRAEAGKKYTIDLLPYTAGNFAETRIYLYGFSGISGLGNLAPMYPYSFTLNALDHLKTLSIGTDVAGYSNANLTLLPFTENTQLPLLETLNVQNCNYLAGGLSLDTANNLRVVEATGTAITGISLPPYSSIEKLHLPSSVGEIQLYEARFLKEFYMVDNLGNEDYSNLITLDIYDSDYSAQYKTNPSDPLPIDWISIASEMLEKEASRTYLSLLKLSSATIGNIETLAPISESKATIEAAGGHVDLSGIIHVTGTWSTIERDYYGGTSNSIWPGLEFDITAGTQQTKHKVTYRYDDYQNDNGDIVTGATIKILYVNDGATAPDIYADGTLSSMPSRAATVRESFEFGIIDTFTESYIPYSGWKLSGTNTSLYDAGGAPIIRNDTVIETCFVTNARTYYVKWYMKEDNVNSLVKTSTAPIEYGGGYNLEAPTVQEIHAAGQDTCNINISNGSATYSIFKGWQKLPTNINPTITDETYNIYADWETGTVVIDDLFNVNNLNNLTPVQLLVLSALDATGKNTYNIGSKIVEGTRISYTLGQDSIVEGTPLIVNNPLRLDGATDTSYATTIQPLKSDNDAFTLVIDYCFNPYVTYASQYSFAVLASCYYAPISTQGIRNGFGLYYDTRTGYAGVRVGFGDMYNNNNQSVLVGSKDTLGQRNIVVLRHPAGSDTLYVYSGLDGNVSMPSNVVVNTLTWSNFNSNAYLNFGKLTGETIDVQDGTPQIITNAKGTIFWSKYWNQDLGAGECKRLAAWPHEQITYGISRLNQASTTTARVSSTASVTPSIYLSALTESLHDNVVQSRQAQITAFSGRDNSVARTICNNRIFAGLPTQLQAILCQPSIAYTVVNYVNDPNDPGYSMSNSAALGKDYVFQYSVANLINDSSSIYATREDTYSHPFTWFNSANVAPYTYSSSSSEGWIVNNNDDAAATYLNIRFPFKAINWGLTNKLRVFRELTTSLPNNATIAGTIFSATGTINSGDIYIDTNNKTYIYVFNNEIQTYGMQIMPTTGDYAKFNTSSLSNSSYRGGWIEADAYWTRSAIAGNNGANFAYSDAYGTPNIATINSANSLGLSLMYTIAI